MSAGAGRAEEVFLGAIELKTDAWAAHLDAACGGDAALRAEVESLLAGHRVAQGGGLLDPEGAGDALMELRGAAWLAAGQLPMPPGSKLGNYTIRSLLGTGGMGVVYVADQERPRRTVALKVIRPGAMSDQVLRRMERETELLGRLKHPGIAQIFEAGRDERPGSWGQPFYAMELVEGPTLTEYARLHRLNVPQRLDLIIHLCAAVEHAHQKGVIHRDLKPANILVDATGQPKILDFGVALEIGPGAHTAQTAAGQLVGTLPYMSPEQIAGDPAAIDTRSDVYALGVLLYHILSGRLPHPVEDRAIPEASRAILEDEPVPLGVVNRRFRGDLETIAARALHKDRHRRYQSASDLGAEIRRFLANEPIEAKRDSAIYILRKQIARHRVPVAATCALIVALSALAVYLSRVAAEKTELANREQQATRRAEIARDAAMRSRESALVQAEQMRKNAYFSSIGFAQAALASSDTEQSRRVLDECPEDLRGWEWRYLRRLADTSLASVVCRESGAGSAAINRDGSLVATFRLGEEVKFWDGRTLAPVGSSIMPTERLSAVALSPDGSILAAIGDDSTVEAWRPGDRAALWKVDPPAGGFRQCVFTRDGTGLVAVGRGSGVWLFGALDGGRVFQTGPTSSDYVSVAVSDDGARIAVGDSVGVIWLFDGAEGKELRRLAGHTGYVNCLDFSPDGARLVSGGFDATIRVWDVSDSDGSGPLHTHRVHSNKVGCVAFSPDGTQIASAGTEGPIKRIDAATGEVLDSQFGHAAAVTFLAFTDGGERLISSGRDGTLRLWEGRRSASNQSINAGIGLRCAAATPDGKLVATGSHEAVVRLWDLQTGTQLRPLPGHPQAVAALAISPQGERLAVFGCDGAVRTFRLDTYALESTGRVVAGAVGAVVFSADGSALIWGGKDGKAAALEVESGREIRSWDAHHGDICAVVMSPDGHRFATCSFDRLVKVWDAESGTLVATLGGQAKFAWAAAFMPDSQRLATSDEDGAIRVWEIKTARVLQHLEGRASPVHALAITPDGSRLIAGGFDNTVRVWALESGRQILTLRGHIGALRFVGFPGDDRRLISAGSDGSVRWWDTTARQ